LCDRAGHFMTFGWEASTRLDLEGVGRVPAAPHAKAYCTEAVAVIAAARTRIEARK
jgi:hypothetical protein